MFLSKLGGAQTLSSCDNHCADKIKGTNLLFAEFTNLSDWNFESPQLFEEYFDMTQDPWQIHNIAKTAPRAEVAALRSRLHALWECKATDCP